MVGTKTTLEIELGQCCSPTHTSAADNKLQSMPINMGRDDYCICI